MSPTARQSTRIVRGVYANAYGQFVAIAVQLVGVPILLRFWGVELYGEWLMIIAVPGILWMLDVGFSQAAANDMTQRIAQGDAAGAARVFEGLVALVFLAAIAGLGLFTVLLWTIPSDVWTPFQMMSQGTAQLVLWLLAAEALVKLTEGASHAGFRATGEYPFHVLIYYTTLLLQHSCAWLLAWLGFGPIAAAGGFLGIRVAATSIAAVLLVSRHPWLRFEFGNGRIKALRNLLRPAIANTGFPIAQAVSIQGVVLILGVVLGPIAVVTYSTLRALARLVLQTAVSINHAAEPELAILHGQKRTDILGSLYEHVTRATLWLALFLTVGLVVAGDWILWHWTHGKIPMNQPLYLLLLCATFVGVLWYSGLIVLKAGNQHMQAAFVYAGCTAFAVGVGYIALAKTRQLEVLAIALLFAECAMAVYTLQAAANISGKKASSLLLNASNPLPLIALARRKLRVV